jgi:glycosyltransferase involved in cell wall biosynthesis
MKVLLYSTVFWPSVGGIETVSDVLAEQLVKLGHECVVLTETPLAGQPELQRPYTIVRRPGWRERWALVRASSIVHANGATMAMYPYARAAGVPFVWTHNGYQVSCVDGLGWAYGQAAPMTPWASLRFHGRRQGPLFVLREAAKLLVRRWVARRVDLNLAGSAWVAQRQPLPRQSVTYNPYPLARFRAAREATHLPYDFAYVGRLVGEKGLPTLIYAFHRLVLEPAFKHSRLAVVGGGDMRPDLEQLVQRLQLAQNVDFLGPRYGAELVNAMAMARVGVVPSDWEEPYGGVTLEWLSAGKGVIVSAQGGHAECAGDAGLQFKNGDIGELHLCMSTLMSSPAHVDALRQAALARVDQFGEVELTQNFVRHYLLAVQGPSHLIGRSAA